MGTPNSAPHPRPFQIWRRARWASSWPEQGVPQKHASARADPDGVGVGGRGAVVHGRDANYGVSGMLARFEAGDCRLQARRANRVGTDPVRIRRHELEQHGEREEDGRARDPPGPHEPPREQQQQGQHDHRAKRLAEKTSPRGHDDRAPAVLREAVPARPPGGGELERERDCPEDRHHDDTGDDSCVDRTESERTRETRASPRQHHERADSGERPEQPVVGEEALVAHTRAHGVHPEDGALVERRQGQVGRHLCPPKRSCRKSPHGACDG